MQAAILVAVRSNLARLNGLDGCLAGGEARHDSTEDDASFWHSQDLDYSGLAGRVHTYKFS
jgi:hypothetical protein